MGVAHSQLPEQKVSPPPLSKIPRYKGLRGQSQTAAQDSERSLSKGDFQQKEETSADKRECLDLDLEGEEDLDEGDSFFDDPLPKPQKTYGWKAEVSGYRGSPAASLSEAQRPASGGRGGQSSVSEPNLSRNGASQDKDRGFKAPSDRSGSLHLDDEVEYDDDFNSHRSDLSKSELSIGEEIEEVSIEGPDHSDKVDESTQDVSVSQLSQSHGADYMEDVG
ncbi:centrosomal protein 43-like isoform X4 [Oreochromis aureus]|nr:centrosomal protein 43-like isoform X4 [Oreochromis aureus]